MMTVKELIAALQALPQDSIVVLEGYDDGMLYQEELRTVQVNPRFPNEVVVNYEPSETEEYCGRSNELKDYYEAEGDREFSENLGNESLRRLQELDPEGSEL